MAKANPPGKGDSDLHRAFVAALEHYVAIVKSAATICDRPALWTPTNSTPGLSAIGQLASVCMEHLRKLLQRRVNQRIGGDIGGGNG